MIFFRYRMIFNGDENLIIEWQTNYSINTTYLRPFNDARLSGIESKRVSLIYTGNGNEPVLQVSSNMISSELWQTATVENLIIDGQDIAGTVGILLDNVYNSHIRNITIKNCAVGIKLTAHGGSNFYSESNRIEHVRMINVEKGIVFDKGTGTGSFAFTTIDDVGISLKDVGSSVGIEIGSGVLGGIGDCGCKPYSSLLRANVWMGPYNPGTGLKFTEGDLSGEFKCGLGNLSVHNSGGTTSGYGIDLSRKNKVIEKLQGKFLLAYHNVTPINNAPTPEDDNEITNFQY